MTSLSDHVHNIKVRTAALPPCRNCGSPALLTARYRHSWRNRAGDQVIGFKENILCPTCDANDPAAAGLLALLGRMSGHDAVHLATLGPLAHEWIKTIRHRTPDLTDLDRELARWKAGEL
ncbi:DUF6300 family protein [Streptomyces sp. NPDC052042]|uniref:DUF6300 family protein n=1 Tax=Streptomyces sp. NPDC052042 TaxID=3365683 RepID=UPI0037D9331C